jgi:hypothetical protein
LESKGEKIVGLPLALMPPMSKPNCLHILTVLFSTVTLMGLAACNDSSAPPTQPGTVNPTPSVTPAPVPASNSAFKIGSYGGKDILFTVGATNYQLKFACAEGLIPQAIATDANGAFEAEGTYKSTSGPVTTGGPVTYQAHYSGTVQGDEIILSVTYQDDQGHEVNGQFNALYGKSPIFNELCTFNGQASELH